MNVEQARFNMIEQQIRPWEVLDANVLDLLAVVRREDYLPVALRHLAFVDMQLPLREGGARGQCMLEPKVEARLLQTLHLQRHESVLEIGTGSGHMAALLAHRAQQVLTVDIVAELADAAASRLASCGVTNVRVLTRDGALGMPGQAPFDAIVLSGSVAEVPQRLLAQLKVGGRLIAVIGDEPMMRATLVERLDDDDYRQTVLFDTVAPRLLGFDEPSRFRF